MKRIIAAILAATAFAGAGQAFAYTQTTVTTTRTVEQRGDGYGYRHGRDNWRHRQWVREQERRRWMEAHRGYNRGY